MSPDEYYELDAIPQWFNLEGDCGFDEERMGCLGDEDIYHDGIAGED